MGVRGGGSGEVELKKRGISVCVRWGLVDRWGGMGLGESMKRWYREGRDGAQGN